jgi:recombination protein RecT
LKMNATTIQDTKKAPTVRTPTTTLAPAAAAGTQAVAKSPEQNLRSLFESQKEKFAQIMPKHLDPERMIRIALIAVSRTPKLLECSPVSLLRASLESAAVGLEPNTPLQHAWLIPYYNRRGNGGQGGYEVQFQIGYRGLVDLARRSGEIKSIAAHCVYVNDIFECELGLVTHLRHVPNFDVKDRGDLRLVYAVAHMKDGGSQLEVMSRNQIEDVKSRSQSAGKPDSPWTTSYDEMARKTVVKRLCKMLPVSTEMARAIESDHEDGDTIDVESHAAHTNIANQLTQSAGQGGDLPPLLTLEAEGGDFPTEGSEEPNE